MQHDHPKSKHRESGRSFSPALAPLLLVPLLVLLGGCSNVLSPAFQSFMSSNAPAGGGPLGEITIDNVPGHVPIFLVNNTRFDPALLDYLETTGVDVSDPNLRPRIRLRVQITYTNDSTGTFELLDGSDIVEGTLAGGTISVPPELTEFTLTNFVAVCDIASVDPVQVEVFVPVSLTTVRLVEAEDTVVREIGATVPPSFVVLQADQVDANNNVVFLRNFDIRNLPVLVPNVQCGSVVGFTVSGTLQVTFANIFGGNVPGYLDTDAAGQASNPGRFEFTTSLR